MPYKNLTDKRVHDRKYRLLYHARPLVKERMRVFYENRKAELARLKHKPCADCNGWFNPWQMDWDHRDANTKHAGVSNMRQGLRVKLYREIAKCDLVCANCHRQRTFERGQHDSKTNTLRYVDRHFLQSNARANKTGVQEPA